MGSFKPTGHVGLTKNKIRRQILSSEEYLDKITSIMRCKRQGCCNNYFWVRLTEGIHSHIPFRSELRGPGVVYNASSI